MFRELLKRLFKKKHYYEIKCPYTYVVKDGYGFLWDIYTRPITDIVQAYKDEFNENPASFFDCGCAAGHLMVQAEQMGMTVNGIDIKEYKKVHPNVQVGSILDYQKPIQYDLIYCNEVLSCLKEDEIPVILDKFKPSKLLLAIHLTTEDDEKAGGTTYRKNANGPRLIKSQKWWLNCFNQSGYNAKFNPNIGCFIARPRERD